MSKHDSCLVVEHPVSFDYLGRGRGAERGEQTDYEVDQRNVPTIEPTVTVCSCLLYMCLLAVC